MTDCAPCRDFPVATVCRSVAGGRAACGPETVVEGSPPGFACSARLGQLGRGKGGQEEGTVAREDGVGVRLDGRLASRLSVSPIPVVMASLGGV